MLDTSLLRFQSNRCCLFLTVNSTAKNHVVARETTRRLYESRLLPVYHVDFEVASLRYWAKRGCETQITNPDPPTTRDFLAIGESDQNPQNFAQVFRKLALFSLKVNSKGPSGRLKQATNPIDGGLGFPGIQHHGLYYTGRVWILSLLKIRIQNLPMNQPAKTRTT